MINNSKKRIVIVTNIPSPYRVDLFFYLQNNYTEYEWTVIYTSKSEAGRIWEIEKSKLGNSVILDAKVFNMSGKTESRKVHFFTNIFKYFDNINPDVIIASEYNTAAIQSLIWTKLHNKKFIDLTDGTLYSERDLNLLQFISRKFIISHANAYIASSLKAKEKLLHWKALENRIYISLLTEDLSKYININRRQVKNRILFVGSISYRKGLDLLFDALEKVDLDYSLHIVGMGEEKFKAELINKSIQLGISDHIVWRGYKEGDSLINEYSEADIFVLPTREDCFGLVLLEAMAARVSIISSKYADGIYDIIKGNETYNCDIIDPTNTKEFKGTIIKHLSRSENIINNANLSNFEFRNVSKGYIDAIKFVLKV